MEQMTSQTNEFYILLKYYFCEACFLIVSFINPFSQMSHKVLVHDIDPILMLKPSVKLEVQPVVPSPQLSILSLQ